MFNETPVVGGPLGFVAADWHLDVVCSVVGAGLSLAGGWHHSQFCRSQQVWAGCISQAVCPWLQSHVPTWSGLTDKILGFPGGATPILQEEDPQIPRDPCSPPNTGLGDGHSSLIQPLLSPVCRWGNLSQGRLKSLPSSHSHLQDQMHCTQRQHLSNFQRTQGEHVKMQIMAVDLRGGPLS